MVKVGELKEKSCGCSIWGGGLKCWNWRKLISQMKQLGADEEMEAEEVERVEIFG